VARGLAHGLAVVVEGAQLLEEALEGLPRPPREDNLARRVVLDRGHGLEERGRRRKDRERDRVRPGAALGEGPAQAGEDREPVARRREGLAHVAAVRDRLREDEGLRGLARAKGARKEADVLGELLGGPEVLGHDHPDRGGMDAHRLGDDGGARCGADPDDLVPGGSGHLGGRPASSALRAALAASSSASFLEEPRPCPIRRSRRRTATSYSRLWSAPSVESTS
jgi:hypothetical protein